MRENKYCRTLFSITPFVICLGVFIFSGCGGKPPEIVETKLNVPKPVEVVIEKKEKIRYRYSGDIYKDPFVPLTDSKILTPLSTGKGEAEMPNLGSLQLKGILSDANGKIALLKSPMGSYIVKNGKVYDNRNRIVKGLYGTVELKGVKIVTDDNFVKYLKLNEVQ